MARFLTAVDIANRGLQHIGATRIADSLGFNEPSKAASECSFVYDKLRRAELQRDTWKFAIRTAFLRPIDLNTMKLVPTLWNPNATYFPGSIVSDQDGQYWITQTPFNTGNDPQNSFTWEEYFGPLHVSPYDSTTSYDTGEIVYTMVGDGTYNVYESLANSNAIHPALPNQWSISTRYFKNQVVQQFPAWSSGTTYTRGTGALYTDGNVYVSLVNGNLNNIPSSATASWALQPTLTLASQPPGAPPISTPTKTPIDEWNQATTYSLGSFAIFNGLVYLSYAGANTGNFPNAASSAFWVQVSAGALYMSLIDLNLGNSPVNAPPLWNVAVSYALNATVGASDGTIYRSLLNGNVGFNPVIDGGVHWLNTGTLNPWTTAFAQGEGNSLWTQIGGSAFPGGVTIAPLNLIYPPGVGPVSQPSTLNVYMLPAGFLRRAALAPKGSSPGAWWPDGNFSDDFDFRDEYFVTSRSNKIPFAFVHDTADVSRFDAMFCEMLGARIGIEVCEPLSQSTAKKQAAASEYQKFRSEAITTNSILRGPEDAPMDDLIACRY